MIFFFIDTVRGFSYFFFFKKGIITMQELGSLRATDYIGSNHTVVADAAV